MTKFVKFLLTISLIVCTVYVREGRAKKLPSYIKPCSKSSPDFDECCRKNAEDTVPAILHGDKEYNIPTLSPLVLESAELDAPDFNLKLKDVHVYGLDNVHVEQMKIDVLKKSVFARIDFKQLNLVANYTAKGKVLVLPIHDHGNLNITIIDMLLHYYIDYTLIERDGEDYVNFGKPEIDYTLKNAYLDADIFGHEELSSATLKELNEEWNELIGSLKPFFKAITAQILGIIAGGLCTAVPYQEMLLD